MTDFDSFGLPEGLRHTLQHMQFTTPTPIQVEVIPQALAGRDILGSAQTGTGKTGAFGIPLVSHLMLNPKSAALVITPTRELAAQVMGQLSLMLGRQSKIRQTLLIGGEPMHRQLRQLQQGPRLIVGTPGRINDHLRQRTLKLDNVDMLVLDETDRMLDMGFSIQIDAILEHLQSKRQTMLFSATLPRNIMAIAGKYMNDPVRVAVDATSSMAENITHEVMNIREEQKYPTLLEQLEAREGSVIIFVKTKFGTEKLAKRLSDEGHKADAIHGDLRQSRRDRVIANFRQQHYRVLVATDVAARGLDIPHIEHVINYDLPQSPEDYIHRIGRTARGGAKGAALCFVTPGDRAKWRAVERLISPDAQGGGRDGGYDAVVTGGDSRKRNAPSRSNSGGNSGGKFGSKPRRFDRDGFGAPANDDLTPQRSRVEGERGERDGARRGGGFQKPAARGEFRSDARGESRGEYSRERSFAQGGEARPPRRDRPEGGRTEGGRSEWTRSEHGNAEGGRAEGRRFDGERPRRDGAFGDKPHGDKPFGARPAGGKPSAGRTFFRASESGGAERSTERGAARGDGARNSEGRSFEHRSAEGKAPWKSGGKPAGKPFGRSGDRPAFGDKPAGKAGGRGGDARGDANGGRSFKPRTQDGARARTARPGAARSSY